MGLGEEELLLRLMISLISAMVMGASLKAYCGGFMMRSHVGRLNSLGELEYAFLKNA